MSAAEALHGLLLRTAYGKPLSRGRFQAAEVRRILVIRRNGIGDMICALPLVRNLRSAFRHARIDLLASEANAALAASAHTVDEVMVYRRRSGLFRNKYLNLYRVAAPLRRAGYDLVVAISGGYSAFLGAVAYATGVPWRAGYVPRAGEPHFAYNLPVPPPPEDRHQVLRCLALLEPLGVRAGEIDLGFDPGDAAREYAGQTLQHAGTAQGRFVLYNASATRAWNAWTADRIARTAAELERRYALALVVSGVAKDRALLREIGARSGAARARVVEPPSIHHFAALAARSLFVMSGDGGAVHVAAAMKKPAFVLYPREGNPRLWAPYGVPFAFVRSERLVADIEPEAVMRAIEPWIAALAAGSSGARA